MNGDIATIWMGVRKGHGYGVMVESQTGWEMDDLSFTVISKSGDLVGNFLICHVIEPLLKNCLTQYKPQLSGMASGLLQLRGSSTFASSLIVHANHDPRSLWVFLLSLLVPLILVLLTGSG